MARSKVIVATAMVRDIDMGEEDWHLVLVFEEGTTEAVVGAAIIDGLNSHMPDVRKFKAADLGLDGCICWQTYLKEVS